MSHPLVDLGGQGSLVLLSPANGFPPDTYRPALAPVLVDRHVVSLPPRAMWDDAGPPPEAPGSWTTLADDLLEGMRIHRLPPVIAVGHSFGAVAALLAATRDPSLFRALALLDPTILPPALMDELREQRRQGEMSLRLLVQGARKRRDRFESETEAFADWRGKPLFADWSDDAVWRYVRAMLKPADQGGGFSLTWSPAWEAHYYESFYPDSWEDVPRLDPSLPVLVMGGATTDTFGPESAALFRERLPRARHVTIPGYGHLFPQAAPGLTGRILADWINSVERPPY